MATVNDLIAAEADCKRLEAEIERLRAELTAGAASIRTRLGQVQGARARMGPSFPQTVDAVMHKLAEAAGSMERSAAVHQQK
jgi:hypothetical protein